MGAVIVHVLLLRIDSTDRVQSLCLPHGQFFSERKLAVDSVEVSPKVTQLFSNGFAGHFAVCLRHLVFQVILPGALAVSAGLLSLRGVMEDIQKFFQRFLWPRSAEKHPEDIGMLDGVQVASTIMVPLFPPVPGGSSESSSSLDLASFA